MAGPVIFSPIANNLCNASKKLLFLHVVPTSKPTLIRRCHLSSSASQHYDIIIAGGGLVGTAMACALGSSKVLSEKKILLLEGAPPKPITLKEAFSNRVSAINLSSIQLFKDIIIWDDIKEKRLQEVRKMQVWDASSDSFITFSNDDMSTPVAFIIENDLILWALSNRLSEISNSTVRYNARIKDYVLPKSSSSDAPKVVLENDEVLTCDLLIGADGVNSKVRSKMETFTEKTDYLQMGVVATLSLSEPTNNVVAWQRFLPDGVIALLPLSDCMSSLVWSTSPDKAKVLVSLPEESFVDAVNDAYFKEYPKSPFVESLLRNLKLVPGEDLQIPTSIKSVLPGSRAAFPLGTASVSRYVNNSVALVGDAAHRVHPLAGQGVNIGFGDVRCLAQKVEEAAYRGCHIGRGSHLNMYQSERLKEAWPKMKVIHLMHSLYQSSFTPIVALRSVGLSLVHSIPFLKQQLITKANS